MVRVINGDWDVDFILLAFQVLSIKRSYCQKEFIYRA
jgi:hypothetical protein